MDTEFVEQHTDHFENTLRQAQQSTPDVATTAVFCGVDEKDLVTLSSWWVACSKTVTFYSQGINQSSSGVDKCNAIINCHLATGRLGKEGAGPFSITGQPNAMGGREVGGLANQLAAHMDFATPGALDLVQRFWNAPNMATQNGLNAVDLFQAVEAGKVKVLWIMSTNPMVSLPDTAQVKRALEKCELVIVSDCKEHTDTTAFADVLLPATGWSEKDGTVTNSERRVSRQRGLLPSPGEAKHDWWAICEVAKMLGYRSAFCYQSVHEIFAEHAALSAFENNGKRDFDIGHYRHMTKDDYDAFMPTQWPVPEGKPEGTKRMFTDGHFFTPNGRAKFIPITPMLPISAVTEAWPFILNTGRVRDQWHTMTRTGDAVSLSKHTEQPYVDIHPQDAQQLEVKDGELVRLSSPYGKVVLKAKLTKTTIQGNVFVPIHWTQQFANAAVVSNLISQVVDPLSGQPESKHACVRLEKVANIQYGLVVSHVEMSFPEAIYWCAIPADQGFRYEVILPEGETIESLKPYFCTSGNAAVQWLEYVNAATGQIRLACLQNTHLQSLVYLSHGPETIATDWLLSKLTSKEGLSDADRVALLVGLPANIEDKGNIICSCYQIGSKQIEKAIASGDTSIESLTTRLKCGSNCGSCIPELKHFLPKKRGLSA